MTIPGSAVTLPGSTVLLQGAPVVPYATPICPDDGPKVKFLERFREQRKLKREKHQGLEEAAPDETSACRGKRCKKRHRLDAAEQAFA